MTVEADKCLINALFHSQTARKAFEEECVDSLSHRIDVVTRMLLVDLKTAPEEVGYITLYSEKQLEELLFLDLRVAFICSAHSYQVQVRYEAKVGRPMGLVVKTAGGSGIRCAVPHRTSCCTVMPYLRYGTEVSVRNDAIKCRTSRRIVAFCSVLVYTALYFGSFGYGSMIRSTARSALYVVVVRGSASSFRRAEKNEKLR